MALEDLNGDGNDDLVSANFDSNSVSVFLNNGDGTFADRTDYTVGNRTKSLALGDVNGDGRPDVATSYTYTPFGLIDIKTDPLGRVTDYDYDVFGRLIQITLAQGTSSEAIQQFEYDAVGNQTAVIDENGNRTEYEYDELNRLVKTTFAVGTPDEAVERVEYDAVGNQIATIDANGNRTEYEYDAMNRLIQTIAPDPDEDGPLTSPITIQTYDSAGNLVLVVDPLGRETQYRYDSRDRLIETIRPDGSSEQALYDFDNNFTSSFDANGNQTNRVYDARGRLIREIDAIGNITRFEYDPANQLIAQIDANGNRTEFEYDDLGRRIAVIDALGNIIQTEYDKVGNVIAQTDANGHTTSFTYDALNRQTVVTDVLNGTTITAYDDLGNIVAVTDSVGNTTTFAYDARNRLISETNELGATRYAVYDGVGNQIATTDRNGRLTSFTYDALNRQTQENWLDESSNIIRTITSTYDAANQLTAVTDPDSTYSFGYDVNGRLITVDNAGTTGVPNVVLTYAYDNDGNLISVSDTIDGLAGGNTAYTYDELDRVTQITQTGDDVADKRVDFTYDVIGQLESLNRYADLDGTQLVVGSNYTYDSLNRLENLTHSNTTSTVAFYDFVYDAASRITQITDVDGSTDYTYDQRDQLIGADHSDLSNPDESYTYDANGNRITSSLHDSGYVTGLNNRLESDGIYTYFYDLSGNLIRQTEIATGLVQEFEWDYRNRLVAVIDKDASGVEIQRVEFTYDAFNRRISKAVDTNPLDGVDGVITYFVYDQDNVILDFVDVDGVSSLGETVLDKRYLHGTRVDQVLAQENVSGDVIWHLTDHLGTVRDLVDNSGEVVNHFTYDSFGNIISQTNPTVDTRYLFTGREFDEETGLYYYRARYYDPSVGRFISEDPISFAGGDTNLYGYVANRPLDSVDPSGMTSVELIVLLNTAQPRSPGSSIYRYPASPNYETAFISATTWFYLITEPGARQSRNLTSTGGTVPWLLLGPLKGPGGRGILRPVGTSGPDPTIELQRERRSGVLTRHETPGHENATEVKFEYLDDKSYTSCPAIPALIPSPEPTLEDAPASPLPTPTPAPAPPPTPAPTPWWENIPRIPIPLKIPNPWRRAI
ncbi:MAG: RHS repeat-associated core domain-containing protein [Xenococcaceae cyanobacterium]